MSSSVPRSAAHERPAVPMRVIYLLALLELLIDAALIAPLAVTLSLKVLELEPHLPSGMTKEGAVALATAVGAFTSLIVSPMFGYWSDRTRSRFGRRRPWVLAGAVLIVPTSAVMAFAGDIATLSIGWALTSLAVSASISALFGWIADLLPDHQRAKASGIFGAGNVAGLIPALIVAAALREHLVLAFLVMPLIAAVATALIVRILPDASTRDADLAPARLSGVFTSLVFDPRKHPQFGLVWLQRFGIQFGYMLFGTLGLYFLMERIGMDSGRATTLTSIGALAVGVLSLIAAFTFGFVAARRRNYTPFLIAAAAGLAFAGFARALTVDELWFWIGSLVAGLALGAFYAIDMALVLRTIPAAEAGRFLGVFNIAKTLPQSLAPALAPALLLIGGGDTVGGGENNYFALYAIAGAVVVASLIPLRWMTALRRPVDEPDAAPAASVPPPSAQTAPAPVLVTDTEGAPA